MRLAKPFVTVAMLMLLTAATPAEADNLVILWGIGATESCATWLSAPEKESEGFTWIMGYWSGLNMMSGETSNNGSIGRTTDSQGIVAEVKRVCAQ